MHLSFSDTQWPICFSCWGVVKHSFIHSFIHSDAKASVLKAEEELCH